jgi:hypothetical protein
MDTLRIPDQHPLHNVSATPVSMDQAMLARFAPRTAIVLPEALRRPAARTDTRSTTDQRPRRNVFATPVTMDRTVLAQRVLKTAIALLVA